MTTTTEFSAALAAGAALSKDAIRDVGDGTFAIVPDGYRVESLEHLQYLPNRPRGVTKLADEASFMAQVNLLARPWSVIYMQPTVDVKVAPQFVAVFNEHHRDDLGDDGSLIAAGWRDHRAVFAPALSREWQTWAAASGNRKAQDAFAAFIEDNVPDIAEPAGATMLEVALSIEAKKKVNFASGIRLQNGQHQLTYEESIEGTAGKGHLTIPETIVLGIPVLLNGPRYRVEARLRYRLEGAKLTLWVDLVRPHEVLNHAIEQMRERIGAATKLPILVGSPE